MRGNRASDRNLIPLNLPFSTTVERVRAALVNEGFGIVIELSLTARDQSERVRAFHKYLVTAAGDAGSSQQDRPQHHSAMEPLPFCVAVEEVTNANEPVSLIDLAGAVHTQDPLRMNGAGEALWSRLQRVVTAVASYTPTRRPIGLPKVSETTAAGNCSPAYHEFSGRRRQYRCAARGVAL